MQGVVKENLKLREEAAKEAQNFIEQHVEKYFTWLKSLSSVSVLKLFREKFEQIKQDELERAYIKLKSDELPEKVMNEMANRLINKFMHSPSKTIRQVGENSEQEKLDFLSEVFNLK
jgi:glutamyl-tRNA reductase